MVVFVTGASVGFGREIAKKFVSKGHRVVATARREEKLKSLKEELGDLCEIIVSDVNDTDNIFSQFQNLNDKFKSIDVLVNNAGLALGLELAHEGDIKDWEIMIQTNIIAVVKLTHFFLPQMVERKKGHIINIGSIAGTYPYPGGNIYGATKAFIKQFSLNLRADLYDKFIRVSNIEPGLSGGSEFSLVRFKGDDKKANKLYENTKPLCPEDIAEAVYWVASLPEYVNVNRLEIMPTIQAPAALNVLRDSDF